MNSAIHLKKPAIRQSYLKPTYADFFLVSLQDAKEQYDRAEEFVKVIEEFLKME